MPILILTNENQTQLQEWLRSDALLVACLCAAWCDVCRDYRASFETLAARHPDKHFVWIDIEDQADLLGDFDVENFPTLLIQRSAYVAFFGSVQPGLQLAERLIQAQAEKTGAELARNNIDQSVHLHQRLHAAG